MKAMLSPTRWHEHWPAFGLETGAVRVVVVGTLGGKIAALDSLRTGRSWLWSNPRLAPRRPRHGDTYERNHDVGGWDELFPTVHPCAVTGTPWGESALTDHGELWGRPWRLARLSAGDTGVAEVVLEASGDDFSYRFTRGLRMTPESDGVEVHYQVENRGDRPLPYLWAAHPLLALDPGMRIMLPSGTVARCAGGVGPDLPVSGVPFAWPLAPLPSGDTTDLGRVADRPTGRAVKVFTERLPEGAGWVSVTTPDAFETLRFAFDTGEVPYVALWINDGGWSGAGTEPYRNLGIEPTTSPCDTLREAIERGTAVLLGGGESRRWTMIVSLITGP